MDTRKASFSSGTVGGESEFPGSFDTSGSVRTSNLYLASVSIFPFSSLISHHGNSKFSFFIIIEDPSAQIFRWTSHFSGNIDKFKRIFVSLNTVAMLVFRYSGYVNVICYSAIRQDI
jgi:hypothetical protein